MTAPEPRGGEEPELGSETTPGSCTCPGLMPGLERDSHPPISHGKLPPADYFCSLLFVCRHFEAFTKLPWNAFSPPGLGDQPATARPIPSPPGRSRPPGGGTSLICLFTGFTHFYDQFSTAMQLPRGFRVPSQRPVSGSCAGRSLSPRGEALTPPRSHPCEQGHQTGQTATDCPCLSVCPADGPMTFCITCWLEDRRERRRVVVLRFSRLSEERGLGEPPPLPTLLGSHHP